MVPKGNSVASDPKHTSCCGFYLAIRNSSKKRTRFLTKALSERENTNFVLNTTTYSHSKGKTSNISDLFIYLCRFNKI
jgi:hypothetical protein